MPSWFEFVWVKDIAFLFALIGIAYFIHKYLFRFFFFVARKTPNPIDDRIVYALHRPIPVAISVTGLYYVLSTKKFAIDHLDIVNTFFQSVFLLLISWAAIRVVNSFEKNHRLASETKEYSPYLLRVFKVIILSLIGYFIIEQWGYDLSKLLAGLGITGIAFAFAARDTFSNIFSGAVIAIEKPFSIGDTIANDHIEGVIVDINFRSSTVRTIDQVTVVVPNSMLLNTPLVNKTRAEKRKVEIYVTIHQGIRMAEEVKEILRDNFSLEFVDADTINVKIDLVYKEVISFKAIAFSTESPIRVAEYKQEYVYKVIEALKEKEVVIESIGFEKYKPLS